MAQPAVERLDEGVIRGFSGAGEVELDLVEVGPLIEETPGELRTIVDPNALGLLNRAGFTGSSNY